MVEYNGKVCWLNMGPASVYWAESDKSYMQTTAPNATKVLWNAAPGGHSAVPSSISGMYESKWDDGPLMRHYLNDSPYPAHPYQNNNNTIEYYRLAPKITGGSSLICGSTTLMQ